MAIEKHRIAAIKDSVEKVSASCLVAIGHLQKLSQIIACANPDDHGLQSVAGLLELKLTEMELAIAAARPKPKHHH